MTRAGFERLLSSANLLSPLHNEEQEKTSFRLTRWGQWVPSNAWLANDAMMELGWEP